MLDGLELDVREADFDNDGVGLPVLVARSEFVLVKDSDFCNENEVDIDFVTDLSDDGVSVEDELRGVEIDGLVLVVTEGALLDVLEAEWDRDCRILGECVGLRVSVSDILREKLCVNDGDSLLDCVRETERVRDTEPVVDEDNGAVNVAVVDSDFDCCWVAVCDAVMVSESVTLNDRISDDDFELVIVCV